MKSLSLVLPGFSGREREVGRIERAGAGEFTEEVGGDGNVGGRKPPGSGRLEAVVIFN